MTGYKKLIKGRLLILAILPFLISCRTVKFYTDKKFSFSKEIYNGLNEKLIETSGLEFINDSLVSFNDSGGEAEIYLFSPYSPENIRGISLHGLTNRDWEDIAADSSYIYIGDFGNNFGRRDTLEIYKISIDDFDNKPITPELIRFSYFEKKVEPGNQRSSFDCEAMTLVNDSIWLFTKNWKDKTSWIYKIPNQPGFYEPQVTAVIEPGMLVSGADYCLEPPLIFLIGYKNYIPAIRAYSINGEQLDNFFRMRFWNHPGLQTEGIVVDGNYIFFSNERSLKKQGILRFEFE